MKTKFEEFTFLQGSAEKEELAALYQEQQENYSKYFEIAEDTKLTDILDKTVKYLFVPECVTTIGSFAFAGCSQLLAVFLPRTIERVECNLFPNCNKLNWIVVDKKNPYYDSRNDCNAIIDKRNHELVGGCKNTIIPADIKGIGISAFAMQTGLKSITIPNNISYIATNAFKDCTELVDVKLSGAIKEIGFGVFAGCVSLLDVVIPKEISLIEGNAFESVNHVWYHGQSKKAPWGAWMMN